MAINPILAALLGPTQGYGPEGDLQTATPPFVPPTPAAASSTALPQTGAPPVDERTRLEDILFGPVPTEAEPPGWKGMSKGEKIGLVTAGLATLANVLQRRSAQGARTFAPHDYVSDYTQGRTAAAQSRYEHALQADRVKREAARYRLGQLDQAAEIRRQGGEKELEAIQKRRERLQNLRDRGAEMGIKGAAKMDEATLFDAMAAQAQREDQQKRSDIASERAFRERQQTSLEQDRADRLAQQEADKANLDQVERRQVNKERRDTVVALKGAVNDAAASIERGYGIGPNGEHIPAMSVEESRRAIHRLINQHFHPSDPEAESVREYFEQEVGSMPVHAQRPQTGPGLIPRILGAVSPFPEVAARKLAGQ